MRIFTFITFVSLGLLCHVSPALWAATPPDKLAPADLVNRPDRWPATITLKGDIHFTNGTVVHSGDKAHVLDFNGQRVGLISPAGALFALPPADAGLVDAANQMWVALTPAQRAIDPDSLTADPSIWPMTVALTNNITCTFGKTPAGTEVKVLNITNKNLVIGWPNSPNRVTVSFGNTDVFDRARQLVLVDVTKRPSRMAAALKGMLVDADGKPIDDSQLESKQYFAIYYGAGWCPPCQTFSPDLVKFADEQLPKHPDLMIVLLSSDKSTNDMYTYMKDEKMPFPAAASDVWTKSPLLSSYSAQLIPTVAVVDRYGKLISTSDDNHGNRIDPNDTLGALGKLLSSPPATQP
jgi:thiol-disulfide isomerase/thioredoxin